MQKNLPFKYCFSKLEAKLASPLVCDVCNYKFSSKQCFENHYTICGVKSKRGRIAYFCDQCNKFIKGANSIETRRLHQCLTENQTKCKHCNELYNKDVSHQCLLTKEQFTKSWPTLVFFSFEFQSISTYQCTTCQQLRKDFKESGGFSWKEACSSKEFVNLKCIQHQINTGLHIPNFCTVWKETTSGVFDEFVFADDDLNLANEVTSKVFSFNYDFHGRSQSTKSKFYGKQTEATKSSLKKILDKPQKSVMDYFTMFLLSADVRNCTFLSLNNCNENMATVMNCILKLNWPPILIKKGNNFVLLQTKCQNLFFLNASNYFKGDYVELAEQFCIDENPHFFPYRLNIPTNYELNGHIPDLSNFEELLDSEKITAKKKSFVNEKEELNWNFKDELKKCSSYKTKVLAKSCLIFLKFSIDFQMKLLDTLQIQSEEILHPFSRNVTTLPAFSYKLFSNFYLNNETIYAVMHESTSNMKTVSRGEFELAMFREFKHPERNYEHAFSSSLGQKVFGQYSVDLYSPITKTVTQYQGCEVHCHLPPECIKPTRENLQFGTAQSLYGKSARTVETENKKFVSVILDNFSDQVQSIEFIYECQWTKFKKTNNWKNFVANSAIDLDRPLNRLIPRTAMRSGLLDIYNLRWLKSENISETFKVSDINGLYAYVCMTKEFPVGKFTTVIGNDLQNVKIKQNQLFYKDLPLKSGAIHCTVEAPKSEMTPFLQYRVSDKFNYLALCKLCAKNNRQKCKHTSPKSKNFTSTWTIVDLNKALQENYKVKNIYEIHFFPETKFILQNFVQCLSSYRLKNSGGLDCLISEDEKQSYCERHNTNMNLPANFSLSCSNVINNPSQKMFFKDMSNSFFGKFSQNSNISKTEIVWSQHRLEEIVSQFNVLEIYNLSETSVLVEFESISNQPNLKSNVYIGAEINAHARVIIYDYIRLLQSKGISVFGVDTDCIFYSVPENVQDPLQFTDSIGHFKSVIPQNCQVLSYHSLGCRNYSILYKDSEDKLHSINKIKGLSLKSSHMTELIDHQLYESYIEKNFQNEYKSLIVPQVRNITSKASLHKSPNYPAMVAWR